MPSRDVNIHTVQQTVQLRKSLSEVESEIDALRSQLEAAATAASAAKTASDRRVNELLEAIRTGQDDASDMHKQMVDVQKLLADVQLEKQALQKTIDALEETVRCHRLQPTTNIATCKSNPFLIPMHFFLLYDAGACAQRFSCCRRKEFERTHAQQICG